jgi:hypothetical protein
MRLIILSLLLIVANNSVGSTDVPDLNKPGNEYCFETGEVCVDAAPRTISGETYSPACWQYKKEFTCYTYPQNTDCTVDENNLLTVDKIDQQYTPLLTNIEGTGLQLPKKWKEVKDQAAACEIDTGYDCTEWYSIEDDLLAKTCYTGPPMQCQPDSCMVLSEKCTSFANGICVMEEVEFTCDASSVCTGTGIDAISELGTGMGAFIAATTVADVVAEYSEIDQTTGAVTLFAGEAESCKSMTSAGRDVWGSSGGLCTIVATYTGQLTVATFCSTLMNLAVTDEAQCCENDPANISGLAVSLGYCDDGDIELAVARKTNRAVQVGAPVKNQCVCAIGGLILDIPTQVIGPIEDSFFACSHLCKNPYVPWTLLNENVTMDRKEQWCKFNDPLAKIIQEQGREQIEAIINSPSSTKETKNLNSSYFSNGSGKWTSSVDISGNDTRLWQWDSKCSIPDQIYDAQVNEGVFCPSSPSQVIAICSNPEEGCGNVPTTPMPNDTDWDLQLLLDGGVNGQQYINKYTQATGSCSDVDLDGVKDDCSWDVMGLPAGIGSQSIMTVDMNWMPHMPLGNETNDNLQWINKFSTTALQIETLSATHMSSAPASPRARIRQLGSAVWQEISLLDGAETKYTDPSGTEVTFFGTCTQYACQYKVSSIHNLTFKPWFTYTENVTHRYTVLYINLLVGSYRETKGVTYGERYEPHCEGFSLEEFLTLDIGKMDLSEYLDTVNEEARDKIRSLLVD